MTETDEQWAEREAHGHCGHCRYGPGYSARCDDEWLRPLLLAAIERGRATPRSEPAQVDFDAEEKRLERDGFHGVAAALRTAYERGEVRGAGNLIEERAARERAERDYKVLARHQAETSAFLRVASTARTRLEDELEERTRERDNAIKACAEEHPERARMKEALRNAAGRVHRLNYHRPLEFESCSFQTCVTFRKALAGGGEPGGRDE